MALLNIIDGRKRRHRWKRVHAIIEATVHDNRVTDADEAPDDAVWGLFDERHEISVREAVLWAEGQAASVTLFIYDEDDDGDRVEPA